MVRPALGCPPLCYTFPMSATALYKALVDAGTREELAEKAADELPPVGELATKADIAGIRADIVRLEARMDKEFAELKADLTLRVVIIVGVFNAILLGVLRLTPG